MAPKVTLDHDGATLRLEILLASGHPEYFEDLCRELQIPGPVDGLTLARSCTALEDGRQIQDLPASERMVVAMPAGSPLRVCAMRGVRSLKSRSSVSFLVQRLDDPDVLVSHLAVMTLAEVVGLRGDFGPGLGLFTKDPEKYRGLWRSWWEQVGSAQFLK